MQNVTRLCGSRLQTRMIQRTSHGRSFSTFPQLGEDESKPIDTNTNTKTRTLRPRSHGNSALPVSALFDPVTVAARQKHKEPKPLPPQDLSELTDFQRELAQNVYAQALATPVRLCVLTRARVPSHFLIPFVTNMPPKQESIAKRDNTDNQLDQQPRRNPVLVPRIGFSTPVPSSYITATHSAISSLSAARTRKKHKGGAKWVMLVNERMRKPWAVRSKKTLDKVVVAKEWEWDDDMADAVKRLLGREVVRRVKWCSAQEQGLIGKIEEVSLGDRAAVLRIDGSAGENLTSGLDGYDLRTMLDDEMLAELQGFNDGAVELALRKHPKTVSAHLALDALKQYMNGNET